MKQKKLKIKWKLVKGLSEEDIKRNVDKTFDILFEATLKKLNRQDLNDCTKRYSWLK
ncbi:MAG: hypothetical protein Q8P80_02945 [Candidatus Levybacteria bacterium]|nr:hypothetical protein [Candidatus Levybacteria bacterium]